MFNLSAKAPPGSTQNPRLSAQQSGFQTTSHPGIVP